MTSIPKSQTGYGFVRGSRDIVRFDDLPVPEPKANEVLLKIVTTGLCRSDYHILLSQNPRAPDQMVMGHEICGTVAKAGDLIAQDPKYSQGSRFCMFIPDSCGTCIDCRAGDDNHCTGNISQGYGITRDGGFQEYLLVGNPRNLIPIPDSVSFEAAASATDAILTPFHAIMKVKDQITPHSKVLVLGAGGLGLHALQILRILKCTIVCVDQKAEIEGLAKSFGAHKFHTSFDDIKQRKESFDVIFDFVGNQKSADCSCDYVRSRGKIVVVGMSKSRIEIPNFDLARREVEVVFNFGGTSKEQHEVLKWIESGIITPVVETRPMSDLPEYMQRMKDGKIVGRVAFTPVSKL